MTDEKDEKDDFARRVAAVRRIKRALHAEADRAAGIDTSHIGGGGPMPAARLAWFREQAGRALSLREADELIEDLPELLDEIDRLRADQTLALLARIRGIVDAAKDGTAMAFIDGFAEIRDALYPDTEIARRLNERRRMTPAEREAERERADADEREAWAGVKPWSIPSDIPDRSTCAECGAMLHDVRGYSSANGNVFSGLICLHCHPLGRLFPFRKGERQTLEQDVHDAVERGEVDDDEPEPEP